MRKPRCPKCGSEEFEEDMITVYGMWGELEGTEDILRCKKCGEVIGEARAMSHISNEHGANLNALDNPWEFFD